MARTKIALVTQPVDLIAEAKRNWDKRGWDESDAMAAATSITRAHQIVLGRINQALLPFGLTFSRYEALALISFSREGALPLGKMGERLQVHPTSVTNTIDRLEAEGLVERVPHPSDRRATLAKITGKGVSRLEEATDAMETIRFGLGQVELEPIARITDALVEVRRSAGDVP